MEFDRVVKKKGQTYPKIMKFIRFSHFLWPLLLTSALNFALYTLPAAHAEDSVTSPSSASPSHSDEADFSDSPFSQYGNFDQDDDEEETTRFFQNGRFFGVSLGAGFQGVTGNRGLLWRGGFPTLDAKIHYWFDYHLAMDMGATLSKHHFLTSAGRFDVSTIRVGLDIKYYFDTSKLSAPLSFASPYVLVGFGTMNKAETEADGTATGDTGVAFSLGAGLEFPIAYKKTYFTLEGKMITAAFKDSTTDKYQGDLNIPDLSGVFYTVIGSVLFTW